MVDGQFVCVWGSGKGTSFHIYMYVYTHICIYMYTRLSVFLSPRGWGAKDFEAASRLTMWTGNLTTGTPFCNNSAETHAWHNQLRNALERLGGLIMK